MEFLTIEDVIRINTYLIKRGSPREQIGILSQSLLESAVLRPQQSAFGEDAYSTVIEKAVALFESLGQNHAFCNANKRTAFGAMALFLSRNGFAFEIDTQQAEDLTVDMVKHKYIFKELVAIVSNHSKEKR